MKKLLFSAAFFLFVLLIGFIFPKTITAQACYKTLFCQATQVSCFVSNEQYCCYTIGDCDKLKTNSFLTPQCSSQGACYLDSYVCEKEFGQSDCSNGYKCGFHCSVPTSAPVVGSTVGPTTGCGANDTSIKTAIGCIPFGDTNAFMVFILRWAMGIGGGIAFLLIIVAAFQIMSSSGNPERLKAGQELMTSAIAGLIMLIFSIFILKVIGVDILKLPGFGQ